MIASGDVTIIKLDHCGSPVTSYPGRVIYGDDNLVVARCSWTRPDSFDLGPLRLEQGDIFIEFYYLDEWFNIFQMYEATGILKGWYCNLAGPAEISAGQIRWQDLALDLLVLPNGEQILLDEDEFDNLDPSPTVRARATSALTTWRRWLDQEHPPFVRA